MEITKMLTISTGHITEETERMLKREPDENNMHLSVYEKGEFCFLIYCSPFMEDEHDNGKNIPSDLWDCMMLAHNNDCIWLCLDCDGEELDELPIYEWQD